MASARRPFSPSEMPDGAFAGEIGRHFARLAGCHLSVEQYYDFAESLADAYVVMSRGEIIKAGEGINMRLDNIQALIAI